MTITYELRLYVTSQSVEFFPSLLALADYRTETTLYPCSIAGKPKSGVSTRSSQTVDLKLIKALMFRSHVPGAGCTPSQGIRSPAWRDPGPPALSPPVPGDVVLQPGGHLPRPVGIRPPAHQRARAREDVPHPSRCAQRALALPRYGPFPVYLSPIPWLTRRVNRTAHASG